MALVCVKCQVGSKQTNKSLTNQDKPSTNHDSSVYSVYFLVTGMCAISYHILSPILHHLWVVRRLLIFLLEQECSPYWSFAIYDGDWSFLCHNYVVFSLLLTSHLGSWSLWVWNVAIRSRTTVLFGPSFSAWTALFCSATTCIFTHILFQAFKRFHFLIFSFSNQLRIYSYTWCNDPGIFTLILQISPAFKQLFLFL